MLTKFDDYAIHQTPEPIAHPASSDRNVYDRYWFNGYADGVRRGRTADVAAGAPAHARLHAVRTVWALARYGAVRQQNRGHRRDAGLWNQGQIVGIASCG